MVQITGGSFEGPQMRGDVLGGADWQIHAFGGAKHAFMNPGANAPEMGIEYHERTAHRAWTGMAGFLGEVLA